MENLQNLRIIEYHFDTFLYGGFPAGKNFADMIR